VLAWLLPAQQTYRNAQFEYMKIYFNDTRMLKHIKYKKKRMYTPRVQSTISKFNVKPSLIYFTIILYSNHNNKKNTFN